MQNSSDENAVGNKRETHVRALMRVDLYLLDDIYADARENIGRSICSTSLVESENNVGGWREIRVFAYLPSCVCVCVC